MPQDALCHRVILINCEKNMLSCAEPEGGRGSRSPMENHKLLNHKFYRFL